MSRTQFQFTLTSPDEALLYDWVPRLVEHLQGLPALADVASDLQNEGLQAYLEIDRDAASRLGVSVSDIDDALYSAFGQRQVSSCRLLYSGQTVGSLKARTSCPYPPR